MIEYAAVIFGPFFAPLYLPPGTPPAKLPIQAWLTKTIHMDFVPLGSSDHHIYDCQISVNPLTNDVTIADSGDPAGYSYMYQVISEQFDGVTYAPDQVTVNIMGGFMGDITGSVSLGGLFDQRSIQIAIDELLRQLSWDQVKAYLAQFSADPTLNPANTAQFCALCVNWSNHFQFGNGLCLDAAPPWNDSGNPTALGAFFAAPLPLAGNSAHATFGTDNHLINPYLNTLGANTLQVHLLDQTFGTSEVGNTLLSIPDVSYQIVPVANTTTSFFGFVASKLLTISGGNFCDNSIIEVESGGDFTSSTQAHINISFAPNTEIPRLPFVWLDVDAWQRIVHEYDSGNC